MRAYSKRRTTSKKSIRKKFNVSKRKSSRKTFRKRYSKKRGGSRRLKSKSKSKRSKQFGGYQSAQVACANSNSVNSNKNLFESSFSIESPNQNNTAPPTCSYVGVNNSGTTAYSCV